MNCNDSNKGSTTCQENCRFKGSLDIEDKISQNCTNDSTFSLVLERLNHSDHKKALDIAKSFVLYEEIQYNSFKGIIAASNESSFWNSYIAYRLSSYNDDLDYNSLLRVLMVNYTSGIKSIDSICIKKIVEIEQLYISFFLERQNNIGNQINKFRNFLYEYPTSKRIRFLWANLQFRFGSADSAILAYKELYYSSYYQAPILKLLTNYYKDKNLDSLKFYISAVSKLNPLGCNIENISTLLREAKHENIESECRKCFNSLSMKDSMSAVLMLAKYYLNIGDFSKVYKLYTQYEQANSEFVNDEFKTWEKGEFYDIFMQALFLERRYNDLKNFVFKIGYNKKVIINNEDDFYNVIKRYYEHYIRHNAQNFESFYRKHFNKNRRDFRSSI